MILIYILSIVAANLLIVNKGPWATVWTAFIFIGLNITIRDVIHDRWKGKGLFWKMLLLIAVGGGISYLLNHDSARIAIAGSLAFLASETVDFLVYHKLIGTRFLVKANGSNVASSVVDSIVFPTLAFGVFMPAIILGQIVAKIAGGAIWTAIISGVRKDWRSEYERV